MQYYNVGKIVNTHGIRGEVRVIATTDFPQERFQNGAILYLKQSAGEPLRLEVAGARQQSFRDHELMVTEDEQQPLEEGQYYYHQIIGLTVKTLEGRELGVIKEILSPGANDVWVVKRAGQSDLLLPVIDDVVKNVDMDKGEVDVELMEGLE